MTTLSRLEPIDSAARPPRRRGGSMPMGLIGMLLLVACVETGLNRLDRDLTPLPTATWRNSGEASTSPRVLESQVLCLGDSLVKVGVMPPLLDETLDLKSYNLAVLGGTPQSSYMLLRRALALGATPRAIVLDAKPNLLMWNDPRANIREWSEMAHLSEIVEIAVSERDPGFIGLTILHQLPSIRLRHELRKAVVSALDGRSMHREFNDLDLLDRQAETNRGGLLATFKPGKGGPDDHPGGKITDAEAAWCYPKIWYPRSANLRYLDRLLGLANDRGILVFFVIPPVHPGVQIELERRGLDGRFSRFVERIAERFPVVHVVDARHSGFPFGEFTDPFHLDRSGATAYTRRLARIMADRLGRPTTEGRWIALPSHSGPDDDRRIEDLEESRVALQSRQRDRR